jgi:quinol monooxygenase YgiN
VTVTEKAELVTTPERADEFASVLGKAADLLAGEGGAHTVQIQRGIERPELFFVLATWDDVDHHLAFRATPAFDEFVGLIKDFLAAPTNMEHVTAFIER